LPLAGRLQRRILAAGVYDTVHRGRCLELLAFENHRLGRDLGGLHAGTRYAQEELVAELGACFLAARTGIEHVSQSATYIGNWLQALRGDKRFIFTAAKRGTQAAAYIYPD
jgi:antirestriction protein ArdC